jgi:hypothetical protein
VTPSTQSPEIRGVLKRPFAEQIAFFRAKLGNLVPTQAWDDLWKSQHDRAFMVAGAQSADLLADLAAAVDRGITEGIGIGQFRKDFAALVKKHGWDYTGEFNWRTRIILRTNAATSYAAGRLAQLREGGFSHWMYKHGGSQDPRPQHLAWDGLVLPADHPFWQTHAPPNGWGCSCRIVGLRRPEDGRKLGQRRKVLSDDWDKIDSKTGEPIGIDKGWGYQPGATVADDVQQMAAKTQQWEYSLAKSYMQGVPEAVRDALGRAYRGLPSVADDARRYAEKAIAKAPDMPERMTLGLIPAKDAATIVTASGVDVSLFDYVIDRSSIGHVKRKHGDTKGESTRGQRAVTADDYAVLAAMLNAPDSIVDAGTSDVGRPVVMIEKVIGGETYFAAFEVRTGRKMLVLQSMWIRRP